VKCHTLVAAFMLYFLFHGPPVDAQMALHGEPSHVMALAPADVYFGPLQMSVLGMKNAIKDISVRIDVASKADLAVLYHKLQFVEDSVVDLKARYPKDTWLPQFGLDLAQTFARISIPGAQIHANDALDWVIAEYPKSNQAATATAAWRASLVIPTSFDVPIEPEVSAPAQP
jgi:hypothetical protein